VIDPPCVHCGHARGDHCGCGCGCMHVAPEERARADGAVIRLAGRTATLADLGELAMRIDCTGCPGYEAPLGHA